MSVMTYIWFIYHLNFQGLHLLLFYVQYLQVQILFSQAIYLDEVITYQQRFG